MWVLSRWLEKAHPAKAISRLPPGNRGKDHPIKPRRRDGQILAAVEAMRKIVVKWKDKSTTSTGYSRPRRRNMA